jgi:hypothetical protein
VGMRYDLDTGVVTFVDETNSSAPVVTKGPH